MANKSLNLAIKVNDKEVKRSFNEINKEYYKLLAASKKLEEGTEEYIEVSKRLAIVERERKETIARQKAYREELAKGTDTLEEQTSAMQEFGDHFAEAFSALRAGDVLAFRTAMAGVTVGIQTATRAALAFLATPIGIAVAAFAGIAIAAQQWNKYNKEAAEANRITQQITSLTGDALDQARVRAAAIEKTFGTDFKQSLEVASGLVNSFGISYEEAFNRIEDGLIRGGKENSEFLDSLKEYPKLFAQAGFTVEDFQRIVNTGIDMKIYSDKLPDAIKEFSLSVMEATPAAREALENAFGKEFTDKLFNGIKDGSITVKDALGLVAGEAENIGLNAQQAQQLTADLFRGAGEDAGGALVIFEAVNTALADQPRLLTEIEAELKRVADANRELEEAQNDALKSDRYSAWVTDLEVSWTKFKTGWFKLISWVVEGIADVEVSMNRFRHQVRGFVRDAFTPGKDADWEALGKEADAIQAAKEKIANAQNKQLLEEQKKKAGSTVPDGENQRRQEEDKKAEEAAKRREANAKAALAAEKQRLAELDTLREEYEKKKQDREADSAVKEAELEMARALKKAESLGATQELLDQIKAEHQVKINEEKTKEEEAELERIKEFDARKREIENELRLSKAESDAERDQIQKEIELEKEQLRYDEALEKHERDLEFLKLTESEKNEFKELLTQDHEQRLLDIQKNANEKKLAEEKKFKEELIKAEENLQKAKANALGVGLDVLGAFFGSASGIYKALLALEKGYAIGQIVVNAGKAIATAQANHAAVPPIIPGTILPNPMWPISLATMSKNILATKLSAGAEIASIAATAIKGFDKGGFTDLFGLGYTDESGKEPAGIVHKYEYVVPEFMRKEPEVPQILNYLETKRKKKLGLYADGGDVETLPAPGGTSTSSSSGESQRQIQLLESILEALDITGDIYFGYEAEQKRQEAQKKLDEIKNRSKIKSE